MARNRLQFDINAKDRTKRAFSTLKRGLNGVSKAILIMTLGKGHNFRIIMTL